MLLTEIVHMIKDNIIYLLSLVCFKNKGCLGWLAPLSRQASSLEGGCHLYLLFAMLIIYFYFLFIVEIHAQN